MRPCLSHDSMSSGETYRSATTRGPENKSSALLPVMAPKALTRTPLVASMTAAIYASRKSAKSRLMEAHWSRRRRRWASSYSCMHARLTGVQALAGVDDDLVAADGPGAEVPGVVVPAPGQVERCPATAVVGHDIRAVPILVAALVDGDLWRGARGCSGRGCSSVRRRGRSALPPAMSSPDDHAARRTRWVSPSCLAVATTSFATFRTPTPRRSRRGRGWWR